MFSLKNDIYPFFTGKFISTKTDLDALSSCALEHIFRHTAKKYLRAFPDFRLSKAQKDEVKSFYRKYGRVNSIYHRILTARSGRFFADYIPDDIYIKKIEPYFTDRLFSKALDNKCFYYSFFSNVKLPELIVMRVGKFWMDENFNLISFERAIDIVSKQDECVCKRAVMSEGGSGIVFLNGDNIKSSFIDFALKNNVDIVIQKRVKQAEAYRRLHPLSVNTYRIMSLIIDGHVKTLAPVLRIGVGDSRVDNLAAGGVLVGVDESGRLLPKGVMDNGQTIERHPDLGYRFDEVILPHFEKAIELVKKAHPIMAHCRLASWDVAIDEDGEAVLIETNLSLATIHSTQVCKGPLFGDDTVRVLDEVFFEKSGKKRRKKYLGLNPRDYFYLRDNMLGFLFGYYRMGYTNITLLNNPALKRIDRKLINDVKNIFPSLRREQKQDIRDYYKKYKARCQCDSHRIYSGASGDFHVDYIPEDMYMCDIDRYLSERSLSYYLDNKCYYSRIFDGIAQPKVLAMRINGIWMDGDYGINSMEAVYKTIIEKDSVVIKAATGSEGGGSVYFADFGPDEKDAEKIARLEGYINLLSGDIIIQRSLTQHPDLAALHPQSLNTIRIVSLLINDEVVILSRAAKIGVGDSRLDNATSGGIYCGIKDGALKKIGSMANGNVLTKHPDLGYDFYGTKIPSIDKCDELVKMCHPKLAHNRLVSWDIAIDEDGQAVLIEANLSLTGSVQIQIVNGPFFGSYTKDILEEVYATCN